MIKYINRFLIIVLLYGCGSMQGTTAQTGNVSKKTRAKFTEAINEFRIGNYAFAEKEFKSLIKKNPDFIKAYDALGQTYQAQKKNDRAIGMYRTILTKESDHYFSLYELGKLYMIKMDLDSSKYYYSQFLKHHAANDVNTSNARSAIDNVAFIKVAMKNPVDITPVNIGPGVNTDNEEYMPAFSIDEKTMYLTRRDGKVHPSRQNEDIFAATKRNEKWGKAEWLGEPLNTAENEGAFSVSADGNYIFFTACSRPGGKGQCDIWITLNKDGNWSQPFNIGAPINGKSWESQPSIASNGIDMYFTSDRKGGFGGTDLWKTVFSDTGWSTPQNLGPEINTSQDEQFPFIHPDGTTLYFSSKGHPGMGQSDLYVTHLKPDETWETPKNLGYPINSIGDDWKLVVGRDGKTAYYSSDQLPGGYGGMDIYSFELPEEFRAQKVSYAHGFVKDADTKLPLGAQLLLTPLDGSAATKTNASSKNGEFLVALKGNTTYALTIGKETYLFHSENFDMPNTDTDKPVELEIFLQKIKVGNTIVLKNVFFDTDKFDLKDESTTELNRVVKLLTDNGSIQIEIGGHTDNTGSDTRNKVLSENRAKAVMNYLIKSGISASRLSAKGYGSKSPISTNDTDEGRGLNRRTELKVIK